MHSNEKSESAVEFGAPGDVLQRIRRASKESRRERPLAEEEACEEHPAPTCERPSPLVGPEEILNYREEFPLVDLPVSVGDPIEGQSVLTFACSPLHRDGIDVRLSIDLEYEQRWHFREHLTSSPTATIALAPAETQHLSFRNTQRKKLDQQVVDEVEETDSTESTIVDKDVFNVARTSSQTKNWNISGNGQISLGKFTGGMSGGFSQSVTESATSSAERVRESTDKSASSLKTLQKVEIREVTETIEETSRARTIQNPYRDRSLQLNVFNLSKQFCVEFALARLQPTLVVEVTGIRFDRNFVLTNGSFLGDALLDSELQFSLSQALADVSDLPKELDPEAPERMALLSLEYLFEPMDMFNVEEPPFSQGADPNDPSTSFDAELGGFGGFSSGLYDATENKVGVVLTTLGYFYQLYQNEVVPNNDRKFALDIVLSIESVLTPRWLGVEETNDVSNVLDDKDYTEIFRRLGGFLAFAGQIRRRIEPAEAEQAISESAKRAEFVIRRTVDHLNCHSAYYTQAYLEYWATQTRMQTIRDFIEDLLSEHLSLAPDDNAVLRAELARNSLFLDGRMIVVPMTDGFASEYADVLTDSLDRDSDNPLPSTGILSVDDVIVPTDGVYIESVAGECVLSDISPEPISGPIHIRIEDEDEDDDE